MLRPFPGYNGASRISPEAFPGEKFPQAFASSLVVLFLMTGHVPIWPRFSKIDFWGSLGFVTHLVDPAA
jgi:hypothetical protein